MERKFGTRFSLEEIYRRFAERFAGGPLLEDPRPNGSKPAELLRIAEQCKKHIRRDGRK